MADSNKQIKIFDGEYNPELHGEFDQEFEDCYNKHTYPWDSFQLHAFQAINRGDDVIVSAPTSSGKSEVGWYALKKHLFSKNNDPSRRKIIYTSPIKTLSNEKFEDMKQYLKEFGIVPGLLTGDHRVNIDSDFLIMTAEILANALFRLKTADQNSEIPDKNQYELDADFVNSIGCVIIDEIHFISDASRGDVWESTIILLDKQIQLVGLSATIDNPESFATWISDTRERPVTLIKKYGRPVPLEYQIYDGEMCQTLSSTDQTHSPETESKVWQASVKKIDQLKDHHRKHKTDFKLDLLKSFVKYAEEHDLMQLCFIIFSKKNCERFAEKISTQFLTPVEVSEAIGLLESKLGSHLKSQSNTPRFRQIKKLIQRGVCFHHAGLPVILKEVIEHLFKKGYIKVLFATETVAIGVNMPIRTIVFISLEKGSGMAEDGQGSSIRPLNAAEFKQICGRAGRRGIDTRGTVVFLPIYDLPDEMTVRSNLMHGPMPKITSNLDLTCHSYLKTEVSAVIDKDKYFEKSLLRVHNSFQIEHLFDSAAQITAELVDLENERSRLSEHVSLLDYERLVNYLDYERRNLEVSNGVTFVVKLSNKQRREIEASSKLKKTYPELTQLLATIADKNAELSSIRKRSDFYATYKDGKYSQIREFLVRMEYLEPETHAITPYGVMVAHVNECNPFILAEIFTSGFLEIMSIGEIVQLCSILTEPIINKEKIPVSITALDKYSDHRYEKVIDAIMFLQGRIDSYRQTEIETGLQTSESDAYWGISFDYIELCYEWERVDCSDLGAVSNFYLRLDDLGEYEGSFIKNMLKIHTIIGNLINLAKLTNKIELIPILEKVGQLIMKGMVNTDSLHVN